MNCTMRKVESSNIKSIGYEPDPGECGLLGTMYIEFRARPGVVYSSPRVPVELANTLFKQADTVDTGGSVGRYFAKFIRPRHKFTPSE